MREGTGAVQRADLLGCLTHGAVARMIESCLTHEYYTKFRGTHMDESCLSYE